MFFIQTLEKICHKEDDDLTNLAFRSIGNKRLHLRIHLNGGLGFAEVQIKICF